MFNNILRSFLLVLTIVIASCAVALAIDPDEYCTIHTDAGAPGSCSIRGDCAVIVTNIGTEECKICGVGGCELTECDNCPEEEE